MEAMLEVPKAAAIASTRTNLVTQRLEAAAPMELYPDPVVRRPADSVRPYKYLISIRNLVQLK